MGGGGEQKQLPEASPTGYRSQRLSGLFGNPFIDQLMRDMMARFPGTAGQPNVLAQSFMQPGMNPLFLDLLRNAPAAASEFPTPGAVPSVPNVAASPFAVDPLVAAVIAAQQAERDRTSASGGGLGGGSVGGAGAGETQRGSNEVSPDYEGNMGDLFGSV